MNNDAEQSVEVKHATNEGALSDAELDRLSAFLEGLGPTALRNIELVDGFFAALICGPTMVMPHEYLPVVLGSDHVFEATADASEVLGLLIAHWNVIATALMHTLYEPDVYLPVLLEDSEGVARGNDWATGFMRGIDMHPQSWLELMESNEDSALLLPIMLLAHEHDPNPLLRPGIHTAPEKRVEHIQTMIASLTEIYRYFEPHRAGTEMDQSGPVVPQRRVGPKVGRNDACPCGSGKKFKRCCLGTQTSLH